MAWVICPSCGYQVSDADPKCRICKHRLRPKSATEEGGCLKGCGIIVLVAVALVVVYGGRWYLSTLADSRIAESFWSCTAKCQHRYQLGTPLFRSCFGDCKTIMRYDRRKLEKGWMYLSCD